MNLLQKKIIFNLCTMTYLKSLYDDAQVDKGALKNPYGFTGQRYDSEIDLNYYKNRYYSPNPQANIIRPNPPWHPRDDFIIPPNPYPSGDTMTIIKIILAQLNFKKRRGECLII